MRILDAPLQSFYEDLAEYQEGPYHSVEEDSYVYRRLEKTVGEALFNTVADELQSHAERFSIITVESQQPPRETSPERVVEMFQVMCLTSSGYQILPKRGYLGWEIRYQQKSQLPAPLLLFTLCNVIGRQLGFALVAYEKSIEEEQRFWLVNDLCKRWEGYNTPDRSTLPAAKLIFDVLTNRPFPHSNQLIAWLLGCHALDLRGLPFVSVPPRLLFDEHLADEEALAAYLATG